MIKLIKKIFIKIFQTIGLILTLIILADLAFRLFGYELQKPMGKLVDVNGIKLHKNSFGIKNDKPTLVIEGGGGLPTEYYHWLLFL